MAKLSSKNISRDLQEILDQYPVFKNEEEIDFKAVHKSGSNSISIDSNAAIVLQNFLPLIIYFVVNIYFLTSGRILSSKAIENIQEIKIQKIQNFAENQENKKQEEHVKALIKKTCEDNLIKESRKNIRERDFIQFDDTSNDFSHNKAFGAKPNKRCSKNILLKIDGPKPENIKIRIGIYLRRAKNKIEIRNIFIKKSN